MNEISVVFDNDLLESQHLEGIIVPANCENGVAIFSSICEVTNYKMLNLYSFALSKSHDALTPTGEPQFFNFSNHHHASEFIERLPQMSAVEL